MTDKVRIIEITEETEHVPEGVLDGIDDVANGRFATKEELREALLNDPDDE